MMNGCGCKVVIKNSWGVAIRWLLKMGGCGYKVVNDGGCGYKVVITDGWVWL